MVQPQAEIPSQEDRRLIVWVQHLACQRAIEMNSPLQVEKRKFRMQTVYQRHLARKQVPQMHQQPQVLVSKESRRQMMPWVGRRVIG